ncbi:MAG: hypothetical protein WA395_00030 [Nitrososphaeraceae archaeon]
MSPVYADNASFGSNVNPRNLLGNIASLRMKSLEKSTNYPVKLTGPLLCSFIYLFIYYKNAIEKEGKIIYKIICVKFQNTPVEYRKVS